MTREPIATLQLEGDGREDLVIIRTALHLLAEDAAARPTCMRLITAITAAIMTIEANDFGGEP